MPPNTNIDTGYVNSYPASKVRFGDGVVQLRSPKDPWDCELKQIAPDEPLKIHVKAPGFQPVTETVLLADGETQTVDITLTPKDDP